MFVTTNRFAPLTTDVYTETAATSSELPLHVNNLAEEPIEKINLPSPISIHGVLDFVGLRNKFISIMSKRWVTLESNP